MSPRFWTTLGWDPSARTHRAAEWQDLIHPEDLKQALANFEAHSEDPSVPYDQDVRYRRPDGSWTWVRCRGLIIRDESGKPIRMLGAHNDITELKRAESRYRSKSEALTIANHEMQSFLAAASHDLKAPVRRVRMFASLLRESLEDGDMEEAEFSLEGIETANDALNQLVSGLLELAGAGTVELVNEAFEPSEVLREALDSLSEDLERVGATVDVDPGLPGVAGSRAWFLRVCSNLLSNAIRYRSPRRPLHIRIAYDPSLQRLVFEDNGIGIEPEAQESIFQPFARGAMSTDRDDAGHGLGLTICRQAMERMGGRIGVHSVLGEGSRFWLDLSGLTPA